MSGFEVLRPGPLTTIQDLGRPGLAHLGVPHSGAADLPALLHATALVGNPQGAAALETTLVGPALRFDARAVVALTGAWAPATLDDRVVEFGTAIAVDAGAVLDVGVVAGGARSYIAVAGGIDVEPLLGSRARDTLTGLGPAPLARGDLVAIGSVARSADTARPRADAARTTGGAGHGADAGTGHGADAGTGHGADAGTGHGADAGMRNTDTAGQCDEPPLRVVLGPREDRFTDAAVAALTAASFTVSPSSNRVGVRLEGPPLKLRVREELPSEGLVRGAIQVPGSGNPIVMLADHPTTGGYPVIAVVAEADLGRLGQLRPGAQVRFVLAP